MSTLSNIFSSTDRPSSMGVTYFGMGPGGRDLHFTYGSHRDALKAYQCSPSLSTIVDRKAQAHIYGQTWILNTQGKAKGKEATGEVATRLRTLLDRPNPRQSWPDFEAELKVYIQLFGYCPILPIKPTGFDGTYATALWIIPPQYLEIEESKDLFYNSKGHGIKSVKFTAGGHTSNLNPDDLFFVKDTTVSATSKVLPGSRVESLTQAISNEIGAYESRGILINHRGAMGILSNGGKDAMGMMPLDPAEQEKVQNDLRRYGLKNGQWQIIVTSANLQWQQMALPTKDLMLFEEVAGATMTICDRMGYLYRLLSQEKSASYNDVNEFKKMLYADFIIPEAKSIYTQISTGLFQLPKYGLTLDKDFSHVPALQEDEVKKAQARKLRNEALEKEFLNNIIPLNRWLEINGEDPLTTAEGSMYYYQLIELGWQFGHATTQDGVKPTGREEEEDNSNNNQNEGGEDE
jgi:hypothetical protein